MASQTMAAAATGVIANLGNYPLKGIVHPHPHDVLCGRGGGSNNHIGEQNKDNVEMFFLR